MDNFYHAGEYKCNCGQCGGNVTLTISKLDQGRLNFLIKDNEIGLAEISMDKIPQMVKEIAEAYNRDQKEQGKSGKLEIKIE